MIVANNEPPSSNCAEAVMARVADATDVDAENTMGEGAVCKTADVPSATVPPGGM